MEVNEDKTIGFLDGDRLFLSNTIDIKHVGFFKDLLPEFSEIVLNMKGQYALNVVQIWQIMVLVK